MIEEKNNDDKDCTVFLFVNSGSGGGLGAKIVLQEITEISFEIPIENEKDIRKIQVFFINLRRNKDFGFNELKKKVDAGQKVIGVVCGGDGTVMWVVESMTKVDIDPMKVPLAIIPLGTGNDFSRNLNWGGEKTMLLEYNYRSLKKLIRKWLHAKQKTFDLWDITAEVFENGKLEKVQKGENTVLKEKKIKKTFVNYFSFGIDGKVGYSFDMHRSTSRLGNLAVYGALGIVKGITKTKTIDELVESFWITEQAENQQNFQKKGSCLFKSGLKGSSVKKSQLQNAESANKVVEDKTELIKTGLMNILFLNIDSYTGGVQGIWNKAKEIFVNVPKRTEPSFSDGKIEIVSFGSGTGIALERSIGGFASRIAQDSGPFRFNFREYPDEPKHRTYLQIDGEFIRFTHPKSVIVSKSNFVKNGTIKVLLNDPEFVPYMPESS